MNNSSVWTKGLVALALAAGAAATTGCDRDDARTTNDAARDAGDAARQTGRDARDAAQRAAERTGDAARDAGRTVRDGARDAGNAIERGVERAGEAARREGAEADRALTVPGERSNDGPPGNTTRPTTNPVTPR